MFTGESSLVEKEGRNVQALDISTQLLRLRLDNREGHKKAASPLTSIILYNGDSPFATSMLMRLTIKGILWILYDELPDLEPKSQFFTPSIYVLLYSASCTYLE